MGLEWRSEAGLRGGWRWSWEVMVGVGVGGLTAGFHPVLGAGTPPTGQVALPGLPGRRRLLAGSAPQGAAHTGHRVFAGSRQCLAPWLRTKVSKRECSLAVVPGIGNRSRGRRRAFPASGKGASGSGRHSRQRQPRCPRRGAVTLTPSPGVIWGCQPWASLAGDLCDPAVLGLSTSPRWTARARTSRAANRSSTPWTTTTAIA